MYCSCVSEVKHGFSIWFEECGKKERQNQSERVHSSIHYICIVHCVSILNDKLCINLNLLIFMLNVLILICLTNTALFMRMYALVFAHYSLFKETIGSMLPLDIQSNFTLIWICSSLCVFICAMRWQNYNTISMVPLGTRKVIYFCVCDLHDYSFWSVFNFTSYAWVCVCVFVICVGAPILLLIKWNDIL